MGNESIELLHEAIGNLKAAAVNCDIGTHDEPSDVVSINGVRFCCEVKKSLSNANVLSAINGVRTKSNAMGTPALLIVGKIYPKLADTLVENQVNWLDEAGNCDIRHGNLTIRIAGQKDWSPVRTSMAAKVSETSIRLILFLLQNQDVVNRPYREIQEKTGQSLGSITKTFELLKTRQYIVQTEKGRRIAMRGELVEWWQQQYNAFLKPKLLVNRMAFRTPQARDEWKAIVLPEGMCWGGDCGANLLDGYLVPGEFEIYSDVASSLLLRTGAVKPSPDGEIRIYRKFWVGKDDNGLAPALVIYADLMGIGDSRCLEAALRIKEHGI